VIAIYFDFIFAIHLAGTAWNAPIVSK